MIKINKKKIQKFWHYFITLRYVKLLSYISARTLKNKLEQGAKQKYVYYYGFQILFNTINTALLLTITGLIFHILPQIAVTTLSFILIRGYIGGGHFDSYTKCGWTSLLCFVLMGLVSKYVPYNNIINLCAFVTVFLITVKYAPVEHKNRPLSNDKKIRFKHTALVLLFAVYGIQTLIISNNNIDNSIMYGVLLAGIIALPVFNKGGEKI